LKATVRIALVEDAARVRRQIAAALNARPGWQVVAECADADQALRDIPRINPDLVLLDIVLPDGSGLDLIRPLKDMLPNVPIVMLTVVEDSREIARAIGLGARGYLIKQDGPNLVADIEDILAGRAPVMSPSVARQIWSLLEHLKSGAARRQSSLTPREREVLELASNGKQRGEIALALTISVNTVKRHFANIFEKLEVNSVADALLKLRHGRGFLDLI
jgi:DNA-binding NarL/FixJ family response regulator